jgi:hypothetical protein
VQAVLFSLMALVAAADHRPASIRSSYNNLAYYSKDAISAFHQEAWANLATLDLGNAVAVFTTGDSTNNGSNAATTSRGGDISSGGGDIIVLADYAVGVSGAASVFSTFWLAGVFLSGFF